MPIQTLIALIAIVIAAGAGTVALFLFVSSGAGPLPVAAWASISGVTMLIAIAVRRAS